MINFERGDVLVLQRSTFSGRIKGDPNYIYVPEGTRVVVQENNSLHMVFTVNKKSDWPKIAEPTTQYRSAKEKETVRVSWSLNDDLFRMATEREKRD